MKKLKTILINNRYLIYCHSWNVYDTTEGLDIPYWVFEIVKKIKRRKNRNENVISKKS